MGTDVLTEKERQMLVHLNHAKELGSPLTEFATAFHLNVNDLYAGKIPYDAFATKALASPAFARRFGIFEANHDLVQLASQNDPSCCPFDDQQ